MEDKLLSTHEKLDLFTNLIDKNRQDFDKSDYLTPATVFRRHFKLREVSDLGKNLLKDKYLTEKFQGAKTHKRFDKTERVQL